jgi:hypothetical protein
MQAMKMWAKARNAEKMMVHVTTGRKDGGVNPDSADRLLRKLGAKVIGSGYEL